VILRPEILYKYKAINSDKDLNRLIEIIAGHHIYFPNLTKLNDPMEASAVRYYLAVAGSGYVHEAGKKHPIVLGHQEQFRILSFTAMPDSTQMWAHYANEYKGYCLAFSTKNTFDTVEPVIYSSLKFDYEAPSPSEEFEHVIRESFLFKNTDWAYENEWRYIKKEDNDSIAFNSDELMGIIIGEKMDGEYQKQIIELCNDNNIPCFRTYTMDDGVGINFLPAELDFGFYTAYDVEKYYSDKLKNKSISKEEMNLFNTLNKWNVMITN